MLYRYYHDGIRYTVDAPSQDEANERFDAWRKSRRTNGHGGKNERRAKELPRKRGPNIAPRVGIDILNGWDAGFALAMRGRKRISSKDVRGLSHVAAVALRNGFFVATS